MTDLDRYQRLPGGRRLAYREYGDAAGRPLFFFHGFPGSRVSGQVLDKPARERGIRVVAPDRPGMGRSTFQPGRTMLDWPNDVAALADGLGIGSFAVAGLSGGGPYAAACAWKLPERVTVAGIVSGVGPFDHEEATEGMSRQNRFLFGAAKRVPPVGAAAMAMMGFFARRFRGTLPEGMKRAMPPADRAILEDPEVVRLFGEDARAAFERGSKGASHELGVYTRPWGFPLTEIHVPVVLWQGTDDRNVPVAMGRYQAGQIPGCDARFIEGAGHLWVIPHAAEVLDALLPGEGRPLDPSPA
jgi:pimeloyl-ACP methyl ester carboxylesterase